MWREHLATTNRSAQANRFSPALAVESNMGQADSSSCGAESTTLGRSG